MGFRKPNLDQAYSSIRASIGEISSPYNDGFVASGCKQELYMLKCWLDDAYARLPTFVGEEKWEQDRIVQILKRPE
jgi:hypothetical protein